MNPIRHRAEHRRLPRGRAATLLAATAVVVLFAAGVTVSRSSLLDARAIEVSGGARLSRAQIVSGAGLGRTTNVLWFDDAAAERRLESNAWIHDAEIWGSFPHTLHISVSERAPVAVASDARGDLLIAGDGTVLGPPERRAESRGIPRIQLAGVVEGRPQDPVAAARALAALAPEIRSEVSRVTVALDGSLELWMRSGLRVRYGSPTDIRAKAEALARTLEWAEREGERLASVSVVAPWAPAASPLG